jgi:hypothetical protein
MRVWLDDERPKPAGYDSHVKSAIEAIELLKTKTVTVISLDHDLGEGNGSGYEVATFIERGAYEGTLPEIEVFIHSQNAVGVKNMRQAIAQAYRFWSQRGPHESGTE